MGFPVPTRELILVEIYQKYIIIHSTHGEKVNRTLGAILDTALSRKNLIYNWWNDQYRILIQATRRLDKWDIQTLEECITNITHGNASELLYEFLEARFPFTYKMKFIAERFGVIPRGKSMGPQALDNLYLRFLNTPIYKETLREGMKEKLDLDTVEDILEGISSGKRRLIIQGVKEPSPLARHILEKYADIMELKLSKDSITDQLEEMRRGITEKRVTLSCMNCLDWSEKLFIKEIDERPICPKCGTRDITLLHRFKDPREIQILLKRWRKGYELNDDESEEMVKARKAADMILSYGRRAIEALTVYGVGPVTSYRILSKMYRDEEKFYRDLLKAKIQYIKNRPYWDNK
jgi:ATP-dependent Lhr-like helicase